jgi:hypothetical protein
VNPERYVLPIPPGTRDRIDREIRKIADRTIRFLVRRLVETAYADGYEDGHLAGSKEAEADR